MSAPTPAPGDDRPREGYYPDPSIPGYVRYWNGGAWVPGTSRPAPTDGEPLSPPPGVRPAAPAIAAVEETGPHFFDEDPPGGPAPAGDPHGGRPQPASAWGADRAQQGGFGGDQDRRVSWGAPGAADPRVPRQDGTPDGVQPDGRAARTDGTASIPPAGPDPAGASADGTFVFRRPAAGAGEAAAAAGGTAAAGPSAPGVPGSGRPADDGGPAFRPASPTGRRGGPAGAAAPIAGPGTAASPGGPAAAGGAADPNAGPGGPGFGAGKAAAARAAQAQAPAAMPPSGFEATPATPHGSSSPRSGPSVPPRSGAAQAAPANPAGHPATPPAAAVSSPMTTGPGGGQSSWAQQVHRLAADDQPVAPWKPPVDDPFQAAARRQAAARPAGVGRRLAARLVDTVVLAGVTAAAAVPLGARAIDHVNAKIDAAKLSGRTVTVWLLDGTTATYLGIVLAVLLLSGVVYEVLPTAKWGRSLGKKLCGLQVRDIEGHEPPSFGAALRRWLVYSVPGLLGVGLVGVMWCLFDRPWHQCWHDKAAHTFVAG
ncbi:RDD family protein [Streptomyces sp. NPDC046197]|uniref:RDD family protein n=1 Tax=Streptomyces sp. NPDC046197 TaxID=3154337 RepID=UPI00340EF7EA